MSAARQDGVAPPSVPIAWPLAARGLCLAVLVPLVAACAPKPLYTWGAYEESLQASYIAHDQTQALAALETTLTAAQQTGGRVPPGVYAEYGFLLYQGGQHQRAIDYFQREAALYPESKALMDKLTAKIREQDASEPPLPAGGETAP